jgi:hypothetical protein
MKYAYLNNVFISRLYLHYKHTPKQKNITKIKIAKINKKILKVKWNRGNTYLLIWWRFKNKTSNLCRNLEGNERKKIEEEGKLRTEKMKKWTEGAFTGI